MSLLGWFLTPALALIIIQMSFHFSKLVFCLLLLEPGQHWGKGLNNPSLTTSYMLCYFVLSQMSSSAHMHVFHGRGLTRGARAVRSTGLRRSWLLLLWSDSGDCRAGTGAHFPKALGLVEEPGYLMKLTFSEPQFFCKLHGLVVMNK